MWSILRHNRDMRIGRAIGVVAFVTLLFSLLLPWTGAAWRCDGRACGETPWACCCDSASGADSHHCGTLDRTRDGDSSGGGRVACRSGCGCVLAAGPTLDSPYPGAQRGRTFLFPPVLRPASLLVDLSLFVEVEPASETRDIPIPGVTHFPPSLRAPPSA
jgi:hypothetical protein